MVVVKVNIWLYIYRECVIKTPTHFYCVHCTLEYIYNTISLLVDNSILKYIFHFNILKTYKEVFFTLKQIQGQVIFRYSHRYTN